MIFCVFLTLETLLQFPVLSVSKSFHVLCLVLFTPQLTDACCVFSLQLSGLTGCVFPGWILSPSTSLLGGVYSSDIYLVFLECVVLLLVISLCEAVNGCLGVELGPGFFSSFLFFLTPYFFYWCFPLRETRPLSSLGHQLGCLVSPSISIAPRRISYRVVT